MRGRTSTGCARDWTTEKVIARGLFTPMREAVINSELQSGEHPGSAVGLRSGRREILRTS
jgi:hypothetical protein